MKYVFLIFFSFQFCQLFDGANANTETANTSSERIIYDPIWLSTTLFQNYRHAIRTKNRTLFFETVYRNMTILRRPNQENLNAEEYFDYLEKLFIPFIPVANGIVVLTSPDGSAFYVETDNGRGQIYYLAKWCVETRTYKIKQEQPYNNGSLPLFKSALIDEQALAESIANDLVYRYADGYKHRSKKRLDKVMTMKDTYTKTECSGDRNVVDDVILLLSFSLYEPDDQVAIISPIKANLLNGTIEYTVRLNENSKMRHNLHYVRGMYLLDSMTHLECGISYRDSMVSDAVERNAQAYNVDYAEKLMTKFVSAIQANDTDQLFEHLVATPFTITSKCQKTEKYTREMRDSLLDRYTRRIGDFEINELRIENEKDLIFNATGKLFDNEYRVSKIGTKWRIVSEKRRALKHSSNSQNKKHCPA